jgi:hypothetical protein
MHCRALFVIPLSIAVISCARSDQPAGPEASPAMVSSCYPEKAVIHCASFAGWDSRLIREAAEAKMIVFPMFRCFSPESRPVLDELRRLNPDIKIIGYQGVLNVRMLWPDTTYMRENVPYELDLFNAVRGDWAWTTAGDTLEIWKDAPFLNPIKDESVNRDLIDKIVGLIARYQSQSGNAVDGIFHDYFMNDPYINPDIRDEVIGDIDFDGNGVTFYNDAAEQALFILWQEEYARAIRDRLGDDFIQVGNGYPPQYNPELAGLLNGINYECFPNNPWWQSDRTGFLRFLDNQREGYLRLANGRTWSICANLYGNWNDGNFLCLLSSLVGGCLYTEQYGTDKFVGWSLDVNSGSPKGEASVAGSLDSTLTISRQFERGEVRISFNPTETRKEFVFDPCFQTQR